MILLTLLQDPQYIAHADETMTIVSKSFRLGTYLCDFIPLCKCRIAWTVALSLSYRSLLHRSEIFSELGTVSTARSPWQANDPAPGRHSFY